MSNLIDPHVLGLEVDRFGSKHEVLVRCPYHDDDHPSAFFNALKGVFYCFACGTSKTARQIATDLGGQIVKGSFIGGSTDRLLTEWGEPFIPSLLSRTPLALDDEYLMMRNVDNETVERFGVRKLRNAIGFPIHDWNQTPVGIQLRFVDRASGPRYLLIGRRTPLWPLDVWTRDYVEIVDAMPNVFVVEGVFGVLNASRYGVRAFALMGAAAIKEALRWLKHVPNFKILFDNDYAGYVGAARLSFGTYGRGAAITPGREADEMERDEWDQVLLDPGTTDIWTLAVMSGDTTKFVSTVLGRKRI